MFSSGCLSACVAREGRKIDLISAAPSVGFELDTNYELVEGDLACNHSARFQSVIGTGRVSFVDAAEERKAALQSIMRHNTGRDDWEFSDAMAEAVRILRLDVTELSCKEHP